MKNTLFIIIIIAIHFSAEAQDAATILRKAREKCLKVRNGRFEANYLSKLAAFSDTSLTVFKCSFRKLDNDSLFSNAFILSSTYKNKKPYVYMYTGEALVEYNLRDSSGVITLKDQWAQTIKRKSLQMRLYAPFANKTCGPLPSIQTLEDEKNTFELLGEEKAGKFDCLHIRMTEPNEYNDKEYIKPLTYYLEYWINKEDTMVVQYIVILNNILGIDTTTQYEKFTIIDYYINAPDLDTAIQLTSIPGYIDLTDFAPMEPKPLLPKDTTAPGWRMETLSGDTLSLEGFKGKLVLIDFFFKSCYGCMLAMPHLQTLYTKYKDKGLVVVGIDPKDGKMDNIPGLLSDRGVTFPVMLSNKEIVSDYRINGYPTTYLIDRNGKVIESFFGFSDAIINQLEEIIIKYLQAE